MHTKLNLELKQINVSEYIIPEIKDIKVGLEYFYLEHLGKDIGKWNKYEIKDEDEISLVIDLMKCGAIKIVKS